MTRRSSFAGSNYNPPGVLIPPFTSIKNECTLQLQVAQLSIILEYSTIDTSSGPDDQLPAEILGRQERHYKTPEQKRRLNEEFERFNGDWSYQVRISLADELGLTKE